MNKDKDKGEDNDPRTGVAAMWDLELSTVVPIDENRDMLFTAQPIPERYREIFVAAFGGKDVHAAIQATCLRCTGYDEEAVKECPMGDCPLRPYRTGEFLI